MQHGFARGMKFIPEERAKKMSFDRMIFKLQATEETRKVFGHDFEYRFDVTLRDNSLEWDVIVINLGNFLLLHCKFCTNIYSAYLYLQWACTGAGQSVSFGSLELSQLFTDRL